MFLVSLLHNHVFGYEPYRRSDKVPFVKALMSGKIKETMVPLLSNFADTMHPKYDFANTRDTLSGTGEEVMTLGFEVKEKIADAIIPARRKTTIFKGTKTIVKKDVNGHVEQNEHTVVEFQEKEQEPVEHVKITFNQEQETQLVDFSVENSNDNTTHHKQPH